MVTDPGSLWIQIDARESEVATVRHGATFELVVPSLAGQKFEGRVIAASDFIDPATRTIKIRGIIANPQRLLKAEMLPSARFERSFQSGVTVPAAAVLLRGAKHSVFVQTRPGEFEPREVELSYEGPKEVVIGQGLQAGEQVVIENTLLLARQFRLAQDDVKPPANAAPNPTAASSATKAAPK